jgi:hypothetical protein
MVALGFIVATTALFETHVYATYDRWHPVFFFTASVPAAFAVTTAARIGREAIAAYLPERRRLRRAAPALGVGLAVLLAGTAASAGIDDHLDQEYYHVINDGDWERFTWIRDNVGDEHEVFLAHPWKAPILSAMTGKDPHAYLQPGNPPVNGGDYRDFARTGGSMELFVMNDITLVTSPQKPPFEPFEEQRSGVHAMDENITREIAEIRAMEEGGR